MKHRYNSYCLVSKSNPFFSFVSKQLKFLKNRFILIVFLGVVFNNAYSQKAPIRYGKVDLSDLEMETYLNDTSASAVVLCDYGYFDTNTFKFTRTIRYKILKKEGLRWADNVYPGYSKTMIRGVTFNLIDGKIVKDKLKNESIFRERITEDNYQLRVAMPNVKVGSVFDIEFSFTGIPQAWAFQREIPVKRSELILPNTQYVDFRKNYIGYESLSIATDYRWVADFMPAFKKEPYINSAKNYMARFEFDILSFHIPGYSKEYSTAWDAVAKILDNNENFGNPLRACSYLNNLKKEIETQNLSDYQKLIAAYEAIKTIKWNEKVRLYTSTPTLGVAYRDQIGNSADINIALTSLLNKLDMEAYPLVLSTRSNGLLSPYFPSLNKLNYVIAYVTVDGKEYLLDASENLMPAGLIPERCLNFQGRVIKGQTTLAVDLVTDGKEKRMVSYDLELREDFSLVGKGIVCNYDYDAFDARKKRESFNSQDEYLIDLEKTHKGLRIDNYEVENLDSIYLPLKETYDVLIRNQVYSFDDKVYINPLIHYKMSENPFKINDRKYPVDYGYLIDHTYSFKYKIPEGYSVSELPRQTILKLPGNAAMFIYNVANMNNEVNITCMFKINKSLFIENEYPDLKEFYNKVVEKESEPIILTIN